ncbi:FdhF/YdeP family oxidoreductase [Nevskia ramosa]|uniref:FdhF/YdeP family oxidoreductase n=1 Tax=Nevskia ramosa TaxID=64002 RepID=UPI00235239A4
MKKPGKVSFEPYAGPAGGWGSMQSVREILSREGAVAGTAVALVRQNRESGFACVSCAWPKPAKSHLFEFCENGAKATAWEGTDRRADAAFFAGHRLSELETWSDYALEEAGRLTEPLRWDADSDRYLPVDWATAFAEIGAELKQIDPKAAVFYASGRASLETSYMYALFARLYGTNNLPDSSNMCHESTSVGLPKSIGVPVGTVTLDDFEKTDCLFFFGQNVGSNSPRMLHDLQSARKRGVPIITFNPLRERGLERFANPQSPLQMLSGSATPISTQYHTVKTGGDSAAIMGICKALLVADRQAMFAGRERLIDTAFITEHTQGFGAFELAALNCDWQDIERESGLSRAALEDAARVYGQSKAAIGIYGMGLTQHRLGVQNVQMVVNLLLLRGNIGRPGAGVCPVRGHSNVQGQRTVGITEKPELAPLDRLAELYQFDPPRDKGLCTVDVCKGVIDGSVHAFIGLGGNFVRAVPETEAVERGWRKLRLTVQIATKLNRSHLIHGEVSYLLPCLGRIERDHQASGEQRVSIEDSTSCVHSSRGVRKPASEQLLSEARIVAEMAKATLPLRAGAPDWDAWVGDYAQVRDAIEATYPEQFRDFNQRLGQPGGFHRPIPARHRIWKTPSGKANFAVPKSLVEDPDAPVRAAGGLRLMTLRSNDQFNTTVYGYDDRFRGIVGTRRVLLMNAEDMKQQGFAEGDPVRVSTDVDDGIIRVVPGLRVTTYDIPRGCCGGYYPECNPLIPLWHHADESKVPAAKWIPVRLQREAGVWIAEVG